MLCATALALSLCLQSVSGMATGTALHMGANQAMLSSVHRPTLGRSSVGSSAGMTKQLDALFRAATGGRIRQRPRRAEVKSPGPVSVEFLSPLLLVNYLVQKHLALLLELSSGVHRLNFLPLAGTALLYVRKGPQMMLAGVYAGIGVAVKNVAAVGRQRGAGERFLEHLTANERKVYLA